MLVIALACASSIAYAGPNLLPQIPAPPTGTKEAYDACDAPGAKGNDAAFQAAYAAAKKSNQQASAQILALLQKNPTAGTLPPRLMFKWQKFMSEPAAPPEIQSLSGTVFGPLGAAESKDMDRLQQTKRDCKLRANDPASAACYDNAVAAIKASERKYAAKYLALWSTYLERATQDITWDLRPVPPEFDRKSLFVRAYVIAQEGRAIEDARVIDGVELMVCGAVGAPDPRGP